MRKINGFLNIKAGKHVTVGKKHKYEPEKEQNRAPLKPGIRV